MNYLNKGESENFGLDDIVPQYGVSSRKILEALNISNENLRIPHPIMCIVII